MLPKRAFVIPGGWIIARDRQRDDSDYEPVSRKAAIPAVQLFRELLGTNGFVESHLEV